MAEYETIAVYNPMDEDFTFTFNGERYSLPAKSEKHYPTFVGLHAAKQLSEAILNVSLAKMKAKKEFNEVRENPLNAQLIIHDNPKRRIALFDILKSKEMVQACINSFPFKGFIGEMSEYDDYVDAALNPKKGKKDE